MSGTFVWKEVLTPAADYGYNAFGLRVIKVEDKDGAGSTHSAVTSKYEYDGWNPATSSGLVGRENFAVRAKLDGSNAVATQYLLSDKIDDGLGRIDVGGTTEVRWTSFGPNCGLERVEMLGTLYRHYARVDTQEPNWEWPFGLVPRIGGGGLYFECVYPPYAVVLYDGYECDRDKPLIQSLKPIAPSLEARFEASVADIKLW